MRNYLFLFLSACFFCIPLSAHAAVRINEVAWMGVAGESGQYGEWIELYNDGESSINLAGWKLYAGTDLLFTLTKTIPADGYLLIERTTASMTDPVPGVSDEAGAFGGGGLSNEGELLTLKDAQEGTITILDFSSGWPAGDATTKETMQLSGGNWVTALASPKAASNTPSQDEDGATDNGEDTTKENEHSTSSDTSIDTAKKPASVVKKETVPANGLILTAPTDLSQDIEAVFDAHIIREGLERIDGPIEWNMGDGTTFIQEKPTPVRYRYHYPGTYTVWVGYYRGSTDGMPVFTASKVVKVTAPTVSLSVIDGSAVRMVNQSGTAADLSGWQIISGEGRAVLPLHTTIAPHASIVIPAVSLGFSSLTTVSLAMPNGELFTPSVDGTSPLSSIVSTLQKTSRTSSRTTSISSSPIFTASAQDIFAEASTDPLLEPQQASTQNRTKHVIVGAVTLVVIGLFILLQRFMAKRE